MEYRQIKRFGNKFLKVTLHDGTVIQGQFLSYKSKDDDFNFVEKINLYDRGEEVKYIDTTQINEMEVIAETIA